MRPTQFIAALALAGSVVFSSYAALAAEEADPVIAKVGGVDVYQSELELAQGELDPQFSQMPAEQRQLAALAAVIDIKTLARMAEDEKIQDSESFKHQMAFLRDRTLHNLLFKKKVVDPITDEDVKARYDKEIAATPKEDEVKARHILLETEEEAKAVIAELEAGKDFVELAKEKSTGPSASQGGDLGYFTKGRMVPQFEQVAFELEPGEFTKEPVKTEFGWHVIKVEDRREAQPPAFEQVAPQVRQVLLRERYSDLMNQARDDVEVEILDPELKAGYDSVMSMQQGQDAAPAEEGTDGAADPAADAEPAPAAEE